MGTPREEAIEYRDASGGRRKMLGTASLAGEKTSTYKKALNLLQHFKNGRDSFSDKQKDRLKIQNLIERLTGGFGDQNANQLI